MGITIGRSLECLLAAASAVACEPWCLEYRLTALTAPLAVVALVSPTGALRGSRLGEIIPEIHFLRAAGRQSRGRIQRYNSTRLGPSLI